MCMVLSPTTSRINPRLTNILRGKNSSGQTSAIRPLGPPPPPHQPRRPSSRERTAAAMKSPYVNELKPDRIVTGSFLVCSKEIRQKKKGDPYLSLQLGD